MVHAGHRPEPLTTVFHHIIPREWQSKWHPHKVIRPEPIWAYGRMIWAPDCIQVCPTGHTNIHFHIREIIKDLKVADAKGLAPGLYSVEAYPKRSREAKVAKQAFLNWAAAGGSWDAIIRS